MPYSSTKELPAAVRSKLDSKKQRQFMAVFNSVYEDSEDESKAMAAAYAAVKKGDDMDWQTEFKITKTDDDQQLAFGWLSISTTADGQLVIDKQGDIIEPEDLEAAAYDYMLYARGNSEMHEKLEVGRPVESMVFTLEKQEVLGIPEGVLPVGWWVGYQVSDPEVWKKIKDGTYSAFSIGGKGTREEVNDGDQT